MDKFDRNIKKMVKTIESIPAEDMEKNINRELGRIIPVEIDDQKRSFTLKSPLLIAAGILILAFLFILNSFYFSGTHKGSEEVFCYKSVLEGELTEIFIYKESDPDITIFWIEKI